MPILTCSNISKVYADGFSWWKKKRALEKVSFTLEPGEVLGIVGPNGAGKSTTLKILMGFVRQDSGSATINQLASENASCRQFLGYLPEHPSLFRNLSIKDHLDFACNINGLIKDDTIERVANILELVGLSEVSKTPIKQYSKGMMQRAGLAYALILEPKILILDEPMSGLDPLGRKLVLDIIKQYHGRGTTILFCSHILTDVERVCDRIAIMHKGRILDNITPDFLKNHQLQLDTETGQTPLEAYFLEKISGASV